MQCSDNETLRCYCEDVVRLTSPRHIDLLTPYRLALLQCRAECLLARERNERCNAALQRHNDKRHSRKKEEDTVCTQHNCARTSAALDGVSTSAYNHCCSEEDDAELAKEEALLAQAEAARVAAQAAQHALRRLAHNEGDNEATCDALLAVGHTSTYASQPAIQLSAHEEDGNKEMSYEVWRRELERSLVSGV